MPLPPADVPVSPALTEVRNLVRGLEAQLSAEHGVDNPAYWRAMSDRLQEALASNRFAHTERAHRWLTRVAGAYGALAATGDANC
jgi:hypothetical protein